MFEKYDESARQALFFSRYEAEKYGSDVIESEHVLLGVLREAGAEVDEILRLFRTDTTRIRHEVTVDWLDQELFSGTEDLPLSDEAKKVLAYTTHEAESMLHESVGAGHLLLGILRVEGTPAQRVLARHGLATGSLREALVRIYDVRRTKPESTSSGPPRLGLSDGVERRVRELEAEAGRIVSEMKAAIASKEFERAVILRETEIELREEIERLLREDAQGHALSAEEYFALTVAGGRVRVVRIQPDGRCEFVDRLGVPHHLLYAYSREGSILRQAIEELEDLLNDPTTLEQDLHEFFEGHPDFLTGQDYSRAHSKVVLERDGEGALIPDFVLEPFERNALCDLLELKRPGDRMFVLQKNRPRFSAAVFEAIAQLREYSAYFDEECQRNKIRERYGLHAFRPRMFVVLGRAGDADLLSVRKAEAQLPDVTVRSYDEVLQRMRRRLGDP